MKVKKVIDTEEFEAEQWFPDKQVSGVEVLCCLRRSDGNRDILLPGDWIITDELGNKKLCRSFLFSSEYKG